MRRALYLLPLLLLAACVNRADYRTEYHAVYATYAPQIESAARMHENAMVTLGRLYGQGLINDSQLEQGRRFGKAVEVALVGARDTLAAYLEGRSTRAGVIQAMIHVQENLVDIVYLVDGKRIGEVGGQLP